MPRLNRSVFNVNLRPQTTEEQAQCETADKATLFL